MGVKKKVGVAKKKVKKAVREKVIKKKVTKKKTKAKAISKKIIAKSKPTPTPLPLEVVGEVTHFFPHVSAGVIKLSNGLKVGDIVQIKGHTTDFKQTVDSMQINHVPVNEAKKGQEIGLKVNDRVRIGDVVYKL